MLNCPICKNNNISLLGNINGYIQDSKFDIFTCPNCDTEFIDSTKIDKNIYSIIYANIQTPGYERYLDYAKKIKVQKHPLKFLAFEEPSYYPIYDFLKKQKTRLNILEVGCGYGYMSYALSKNHNVIGLDLSNPAILIAKQYFPQVNFVNEDFFDFKSDIKYDVITASEVIEHLEDIHGFLDKCASLLNENGIIILSTQNKSIYKTGFWNTELPPVHIFWFSKQSFRALGFDGFDCSFTNFKNYYGKKELKFKYLFNPTLSKESILARAGTSQPLIKSQFFKLVRAIIYWYPLRIILKHVANLFEPEDPTLGILLKKKTLNTVNDM